jgi:hypothetical protein
MLNTAKIKTYHLNFKILLLTVDQNSNVILSLKKVSKHLKYLCVVKLKKSNCTKQILIVCLLTTVSLGLLLFRCFENVYKPGRKANHTSIFKQRLHSFPHLTEHSVITARD